MDRIGDLPELTTRIQSESDHVAAATDVEYVDQVSVLGHGIRLASARDYLVHQREIGAMHNKHRDLSAAPVDREEKRVIAAESKRALRFQGIGHTSGSPPAGCKSAALL